MRCCGRVFIILDAKIMADMDSPSFVPKLAKKGVPRFNYYGLNCFSHYRLIG